jgi:hypothetical protein
MSILEKATHGKLVQPNLWIVYGHGKVGKSSLGAEGPNPIFIGPESGTANLDVTRIPTNSYQEVMAAIAALQKDNHNYQTLVIDSLDWLEPLVWEHVVETVAHEKGHRVKGIEDYGYKAGYVHALTPWRKIISELNKLRETRKMHIIAIGHPHSKEAKDPTVATEYNRVQLKLHDKASALWKEYVDCIFFINHESLVAVDKKGKTRAISNQDTVADRYIFTEWSTAWDAGNRFGLPPRLPYEKGTGWQTIMTAIAESNPEGADAIKRSIANLVEQIQDDKLRTTIEESVVNAGEDVVKLERFLSRIKIIINTPTT